MAGIVVENYKLINRGGIDIVKEVILPIRHNLVVNPGVQLEDIEQVYSHPKALEQCTKLFNQYPNFKPIKSLNTAISARELSLKPSITSACICSFQAAKEYGLDIILPDIQDSDDNWTRFLFVKNSQSKVVFQQETLSQAQRASIILSLDKSKQGSFYQAVSPFVKNFINILNIHSVSLGGSFFEYTFYIDFEVKPGQKEVFLKSFEESKKYASNSKFLGIFISNIVD